MWGDWVWWVLLWLPWWEKDSSHHCWFEDGGGYMAREAGGFKQLRDASDSQKGIGNLSPKTTRRWILPTSWMNLQVDSSQSFQIRSLSAADTLFLGPRIQAQKQCGLLSSLANIFKPVFFKNPTLGRNFSIQVWERWDEILCPQHGETPT